MVYRLTLEHVTQRLLPQKLLLTSERVYYYYYCEF